MKTTIAACALVALLASAAAAPPVPGEPPAKAAGPGEVGRLMLGAWQGGSCMGDYQFGDDGTYVLSNYTPGGNTLTGTWSIRWDALPPTLVLLCKTSDIKTKGGRPHPDRIEYEYLNKPLEVKLIELNAEHLVFLMPDGKTQISHDRPSPRE
jgi:hypothetical protein